MVDKNTKANILYLHPSQIYKLLKIYGYDRI